MTYSDELIENRMVVYAITNKINNKKYIGITSNSFAERYPHGIRAHHNPHLRKSVRKYGHDNFKVELLEKNIGSIELLQELEMKYIKEYNTCDSEKGYNKSLGGFGVRQTKRSKEHCMNLSRAKMGINPLASYTKEQMDKRNAKLSRSLSGKGNPRYGMTKDKLQPETLEKLRQAALGKKNPMYGKNIKDYMTKEAYEEWKRKACRPQFGAENPNAKPAVIVYKNKAYMFGCMKEGIEYFKSLGEYITISWIYRGIAPKYKDKFQYIGYEKEYIEHEQALA